MGVLVIRPRQRIVRDITKTYIRRISVSGRCSMLRLSKMSTIRTKILSLSKRIRLRFSPSSPLSKRRRRRRALSYKSKS